MLLWLEWTSYLSSRANPLNWSLILELNQYARSLSSVSLSSDYTYSMQRRSHETVKFIDSHLPHPIPNPFAMYSFFHGENLIGPFLRKVLFAHVAVAYLFLLCQTMAVVHEMYIGSCSDFTTYFALLWMGFLFLHFLSFLFGVSLALNNYELLSYAYNYRLPLIGKKQLSSIGMVFFMFNMITFSTLYSVSILDIVLFSIWNLFFYDSQLEYRKLFFMTSQQCDIMFEGFSVCLLMVCVIQFNGLYPIFTTLACIFACYFNYRIHLYVRGALPLRRLQLNFHFSMSSMLFALSFLTQFMWSAYSVSTSFLIALLQAIFIPPAFDTLDLEVLRAYYGHLLTAPTVHYWIHLFSDAGLKIMYFQYFFVVYFLRLVHLLYIRC
jgi:hypothetical protein